MDAEEKPDSSNAEVLVRATGEGPLGALTQVSEKLGDAVDAVIGLPGVRRNLARAVSQLVLGMADVGKAILDIGKAKAQQSAGRIRGETEFEQAIVEQAIRAVGAGQDPIEQRARLHEIFRGRREQRNREAVLDAALEGIAEETPSSDTASEIDDDWLMYFSEAASKISDDGIRTFMARMLQGEVAQPGSFSVDAVLRVSTIHPRTAALLKRFSDHLAVFPTSAGILVGPFGNPAQNGLPELGLPWDDLTDLQSAGLVRGDLSARITLSPVPQNSEYEIRFCGRPAFLRATKTAEKLVLKIVFATHSGAEILNAVPPPGAFPLAYATRMQDWFYTSHGIKLTF
jgi:hypothetical protein